MLWIAADGILIVEIINIYKTDEIFKFIIRGQGGGLRLQTFIG